MPFHISSWSILDFKFLHILLTSVCKTGAIHFSHCIRCVVVFHSFNWQFPNDLMLSISPGFICHPFIFCSYLLPMIEILVCDFLIYSGYKFFIWYALYQRSLIVFGFAFHFFIFFRFYLFIFRESGREREMERNINVWLPVAHPLLGTWPATQACALTGNWTSDPLVCRPALNPRSHISQDIRENFKSISGPVWVGKLVRAF